MLFYAINEHEIKHYVNVNIFLKTSKIINVNNFFKKCHNAIVKTPLLVFCLIIGSE